MLSLIVAHVPWMDPANLASVPALAAASFDPVTWLVNYGVAGIIIALLVTGQLSTKAEVNNLKAELTKATEREKEKDIAMAALLQQVTTHTVPQLGQLADVIDRLPTRSDGDILTQLTRLTATIEALERRSGGKP